MSIYAVGFGLAFISNLANPQLSSLEVIILSFLWPVTIFGKILNGNLK